MSLHSIDSNLTCVQEISSRLFYYLVHVNIYTTHAHVFHEFTQPDEDIYEWFIAKTCILSEIRV